MKNSTKKLGKYKAYSVWNLNYCFWRENKIFQIKQGMK